VPTSYGSTLSPPCARIDLLKQVVGLDITKMYPAGAPADKELEATWTWDFFSQAAEKCHKAGYPFGMPMSTTSDAVQWVGAMFNSYGAQLVDAKGAITVKSDATRTVLEWFKKTVPFFPPSVFAWDDASNNKALISGQSALIFNAPSAWAVAKRDAPKVAEQLWTFPAPKGRRAGTFPADIAIGDLEFFRQQSGGEEPPALSVDGGVDRQAAGGRPGFRRAAVREARLARVGRCRAAEGHLVQFPAARRGDRLSCRLPGAGADRGADVLAGNDVQDDRPVHAAGQIDRGGDRLWRERARGIHADLTAAPVS